MKKRFLSMFLALCMVFTLLPGRAMAVETTNYDVWVGGTQVTSSNMSNVLAGGSNDDKVSYDPGTSTLTLKGIDLELSNASGYGIEFKTDGTIALAPGSVNTVTTSGSASFPILIGDFKNLTINGSGSLSANNTTGSNSGAIYVSGNLIIDGAEVSAYHEICTLPSTGPSGIYSLGSLTIKENSTVTASGDGGIYASDGITIESGTVESTGWETAGIGTEGTLTISGGTVNSNGGTGNHAVWANAIELNGGTVTSTAAKFYKPFSKEPVLSGMVHKQGTGTWDNTEGIACTYEEGIPVEDAAAPVITNDLNTAQVTYALGDTANALDITATVSDGGEITYDWYSNTANTTSGGTKLNVTTKTYTPSTLVPGITYYYCVVTNTNNSATRNKTATATSAIANIRVNAPTYYNVWVGSTRVTSANAGNVLAGGINDGKVSYDPGTSTLTLNGINLEVINDEGNGIEFRTDGTVTLAPGSVNTITASGSAYYPIFTNNLTINGSGSLIANNTTGGYSHGISVYGNLIIDGATVSATHNGCTEGSSRAMGIYASSSLTIKGNSKVTASGDSGIYAQYGITIEPGTVKSTGLKGYGIGTNRKLTINGGTVNSYGGSESDAVWADTIELNGGTVTATAAKFYKPFSKEPVLSGMVHKQGTGTWDNKAGTACTYEEGIPVEDAAVPVITNDLNTTQVTYTQGDTSNALEIAATVSDGGEITYDWYSNTTNTTSGGTKLNVTTKTYTPSTAVPGITFYYCVVTNTNNSATRNKTATVTSAIANIKVTAAPVSTYTITLNTNGGSPITPAALTTDGDGKLTSLPTPSRGSRYRFEGWFTAASGGTQVTTSTVFNANTTIYAHWTYIGGSSDNDGSDPVPGQPNPPDQKEDNKDSIKVIISNKIIAEAIEKADGITLVLNLSTGNNTASGISINLPRSVQEAIINKKILNTLIVVDQPDIKINMDLKTITEINKQAQADVNITAIMLSSSSLEGDAKAAISSRPVFKLEVGYGNNKLVQSFGGGIMSVSIPYTLNEGERAGNLCAVYVDEKGVVHWLANSIYDNAAKALRFTTPHFSTYGVGYRMDAPSFTDIANHYRKDDIEFVTVRGLLEGTGATTFEPDRAITRAMLVTALGRLAKADVSSYKQSSFTDVKNDANYMGYIEWANSMGILIGIDGKFSPDMAVTREHMAVIFSNYAKAMGITLEKVYEEVTFADKSKISDYAKESVKELQMAGIITNRNNNLFDPTSAATRSEVSAMLRRFIESTTGSSIPEGWIMNDSGKWMYYEKGKAVTGKKEISGLIYEFNQYGETASSPGNPVKSTDNEQKEDEKEEEPKNTPPPTPIVYKTYRVKKGDSFWKISRIYKCSMYELAKINNKTIKDIIYPGEVLKIPKK